MKRRDPALAIEAYARRYADRYVIEALRATAAVDEGLLRKQAELRRSARRLAQALGHEPTEEQCADAANLAVDRYREVLTLGRATVELDALSPERRASVTGSSPDGSVSAEEYVARVKLRELASGWLAVRPQRLEAMVLELWLEGRPAREIAVAIGRMDLLMSRISQLVARGLELLAEAARARPHD